MHQKWGQTKLIGCRIITIDFDNKRFWKFTTALGRTLSGKRLFFTKLFLPVSGAVDVESYLPGPGPTAWTAVCLRPLLGSSACVVCQDRPGSCAIVSRPALFACVVCLSLLLASSASFASSAFAGADTPARGARSRTADTASDTPCCFATPQLRPGTARERWRVNRQGAEQLAGVE